MNNPHENSLQQRNAQLRGIDAILTQCQRPEKLYPQPAFRVLQMLLTFEDRIPLIQALESLTPTERRIMEIARDNMNLSITSCKEQSALPDHSCLVIQERRVGHVSLLLPHDLQTYPLAEDHCIIGAIRFSPQDYSSLLKYDKIIRATFQEQSKEAALVLHAMQREGALADTILQIRDTLSHMAPFVVYVWHHIYSTFDQAGKNLIARTGPGGEKGILSAILQKPVEQWSREEQVLLYCSHILLQSGGPYRLEEMNSSQLTPASVQAFLDKKAHVYSRHSGQHMLPEWSSLTLLEKAQWLNTQRSSVDAHWQRYRLIHGINMRKEERITSPLSHGARERLQPHLTGKIHRLFGMYPHDGESRRAYWRRVTWRILQMEKAYRRAGDAPHSNEEAPPLALLIGTIVWSALEITASDIAMSSCVRDLSRLSTSGALNLEKSDFYCCVMPSAQVVARYPADKLAEILRMISARMQFNRWHFIPSTVALDTIPDRRNWFYAPTIPDIAAWVDQHHAGHVEAAVRHTIRYPSSLTLFGRPYTGIYDIRLMRQQGQEYTLEELHLCGNHVIDMGYVLQAIGDYIEETGEAVAIDIFDASWYKSQLWRPWVDRYQRSGEMSDEKGSCEHSHILQK